MTQADTYEDRNSMAQHEGGCLCGNVRYRFEGEPLLAAVCHCRNCQRQSGAAFSFVIAVPDHAYHQSGDTRVFHDIGDSGKAVQRHFCQACGSPIVSLAEAISGLTIIKAATLDEPGRWTPVLEAYCDSSLPWVLPMTEGRYPRSNMEEPA
jgi:hypothetical protein